MKLRYKNIFGFIAVAILLSIFIASQLYFSLHENQTIDEGVHISAGYSYLKTFDFRMNPEHPPLIKMFAALPLFFTPIQLNTQSKNWVSGDQWQFAREFMYSSGNDADTILLLGRVPIILITLFLCLLVLRWSFHIAGWPGVIFSAGWFISSPIILAHGHYITTDIPVAFGFLLSAFCFRNYILKGTKKWLLLTVLTVSLSVNIKFSALLLFALLPILYLYFYLFKKNQYPHLKFQKLLIFTILMILGSFIVSFLLTGGTTSIMKNDSYGGTERILETSELLSKSTGLKAFGLRGFLYSSNHIPIPAYPYVNGLLKFLGHNANGHNSFFMGTFSVEGSPWYFPVSFFIKTPLAFMITLSLLFILFVKQTIAFFRKERHLAPKKGILFAWLSSKSVDFVILTAVPLVYMLFSMTSHINIGVRHIAPLLPFLFVGVTFLFNGTGKYRKIFETILFAILAIGSISVIYSLPFPLSYYSEIIGGAKNGHVYMMDSNLDWGQNLKHLKSFTKANNIKNVCIAYFGQGNYDYEKLAVQRIPKNWETEQRKNLDCVAVISAEILYGQDSEFTWLQNHRANKLIGGMYIYDLRK